MAEEKAAGTQPENPPSPLKEIVQPFVDLVHAPRPLWGLNVSYFMEGLVYFGWLSLLPLFFNRHVGLNDLYADWMVSFLTAGITLSMFFFGGRVDKIGVRRGLLLAVLIMLAGRFLMVASTMVLPTGGGAGSGLFWTSVFGLLGVIIGYGLYQPAAYAGVREYCDGRTAAMGYAMLYALMNAGGALPGFISPPIRSRFGIPGVFWTYVVLTGAGLLALWLILTKRVERRALESVAEYRNMHEKEKVEVEQRQLEEAAAGVAALKGSTKYRLLNWLQVLLFLAGMTLIPIGLITFIYSLSSPKISVVGGVAYLALSLVGSVVLLGLGDLLQVFQDIENHGDSAPEKERTINPRKRISYWIKNHPMADPKFAFFIFALIPVQTLFAHNWLTLPQYVSRCMGALGDRYMEFFVNFINPTLIFVLTPMVAALTRKRKVYNMMIIGTFVMGAPTFFLAIPAEAGTRIWLLVAYLTVMSLGEAMWQPRFLQYAAEIAPKGRTGAYMGVAQFPWFLTKVVTGLYAGWFLMRYVPEPGKGVQSPEVMWLIYGCIAMCSSLFLLLAKGWVGKDFKTKAA